MMLVEALRPRSSSALRNCAKLLSAFLMPASEVGPLRPDVTVLRLSPVLRWLLAAPLWWRHDACCAVFGSRVPELTRRFADVEDHY
jgi:hypothetical protein